MCKFIWRLLGQIIRGVRELRSTVSLLCKGIRYIFRLYYDRDVEALQRFLARLKNIMHIQDTDTFSLQHSIISSLSLVCGSFCLSLLIPMKCGRNDNIAKLVTSPVHIFCDIRTYACTYVRIWPRSDWRR